MQQIIPFNVLFRFYVVSQIGTITRIQCKSSICVSLGSVTSIHSGGHGQERLTKQTICTTPLQFHLTLEFLSITVQWKLRENN